MLINAFATAALPLLSKLAYRNESEMEKGGFYKSLPNANYLRRVVYLSISGLVSISIALLVLLRDHYQLSSCVCIYIYPLVFFLFHFSSRLI